MASAKLRQLNVQTELLRDLGIYGDVAETYLEVLQEKFGVDLTFLVFEKYFASEFPAQGLIENLKFWFNPFRKSPTLRYAKYSPVTVDMIKKAMISKRWDDQDD